MYKIIEHLHVKPGKGAAFVRTKLKNLSNGGNLEKTFRAGEVVDGADLTKTELQFNYMDGGDFVFMNMESFETETVKGDTVGEQARHADRARMPRAANANSAAIQTHSSAARTNPWPRRTCLRVCRDMMIACDGMLVT